MIGPIGTRRQETVGAILAGGRSSRMGQDKAALLLNGTSFLEHVVRGMEPCCSRILIVGRSPESARFLPVDASNKGGVEWVLDDEPDQGPLAGLAAALRRSGGCPVFLAGCDMPFLRPRAVLRVLGRLGENEAAVPRIGGVWQPLHAVYAAVALARVERQLESGRRSMMSLLDNLRVGSLPEDLFLDEDPDLLSFVSLDTPSDLAALKAAGRNVKQDRESDVGRPTERR